MGIHLFIYSRRAAICCKIAACRRAARTAWAGETKAKATACPGRSWASTGRSAEMNGLEATRAIRAFEHCPPESGIPIIAMTANVFADDVKACLEAGMNSHVGKPLDMQVLAAEICRQIRRHTALLESADFTKLGN